MRNQFASTLYELGKDDPSIHVIVADISPAGSIGKFRKEFPKRFINVGVSEQIMIGLAAGLAQGGLKPFCYTIATFALYRTFEFVRNDLAYQSLPVTVVGIGGGVTYSTLGATHHAMEDISVAWSIPNLSILAPCDPYETDIATKICAANKKGPIYLRLGKAGEPDFTSKAVAQPEFGKFRTLQSGFDTCVISYGPIMKLADKVCKALREQGREPMLVSAFCLSPLDEDYIKTVLNTFKTVVVIEEMVSSIGLGTRIKAIAHDIGSPAKIKEFGLRHEFLHVYGTHDDVLTAHGLTFLNIMKALL